MCGLEAYADAIVGTLNVEYRKRTTIAVELAAKVRLSHLLRIYVKLTNPYHTPATTLVILG